MFHAFVDELNVLATYVLFIRPMYTADERRQRRCIANYCYLRENETSAASTASSTSAMASLTTGSVAILSGKRRGASLARFEPIKAESRKHVVNRPHFAAASRRISRYLSF